MEEDWADVIESQFQNVRKLVDDEEWTNPFKIVWARFPWWSCRAVLERKGFDQPYGRCGRLRKHKGDHAFEWGPYVVRFETKFVGAVQRLDS